jgi:hypothetical protein
LIVVLVEPALVNLVAEEVHSIGNNVDSKQDQEGIQGSTHYKKIYKSKAHPKPQM